MKRFLSSVNFHMRFATLNFAKIFRMKLFKIFVGIIGFFALIFGVSLLFPKTYKIERSTVINLPVYQSFAYMNTIQNWQDWSPWNSDLDSTMQSFYSKNPTGTGATQYFRGDLVGVGTFRIEESVLNEKIHYKLSINEGTMESEATFYFKPIGSKTQLSWVDEGDVGYNPLFRFLLPSKVSDTEKGFEEGLIAIKKGAENKALLKPNLID
jgi:hypothetical protein